MLSLSCKRDKNKNDGALIPQKDTSIYPGYEEFYSDESGNDSDSVAVDVNQVEANTNDQIMVEDQTGKIKPATENQVNNSKNFYIIIGSFKNETNAQKKLDYYKKIGYTAEILPKFGDYNRVSAVSFNDETSARAELKNLRSKFNDKSFWLLIR